MKTDKPRAAITKRQATLFAKIHISNHAQYFDMDGLRGCGVTDEEAEMLVEAVHELANKLIGIHRMNFGSNKDIIDYVKI